MSWKHSKPNCNGIRRDNVALRTTCNKTVKFRIIKIRTGCQFVRYFTTAKPKLGRTKPSTGPHAARGLDIAGLHNLSRLIKSLFKTFLTYTSRKRNDFVWFYKKLKHIDVTASSFSKLFVIKKNSYYQWTILLLQTETDTLTLQIWRCNKENSLSLY